MKVLVLGHTGMLGSMVARVMRDAGHDVLGIRVGETVLEGWVPEAVINCFGIIPARGDSVVNMIDGNATYPHKMAGLCDMVGARLIHVSTDCVFSGRRGDYTEDDTPDATDIYGRSKALGEVGAPHVTLRTSIIGHGGKHGLVNWLMQQQGDIPGYVNAWFSGLTTLEFARVIRDHVLPRPDLQGLYHVGGEGIRKARLIARIAEVYGLPVRVVPVEQPVVDRTLISARFRDATGYYPPMWTDMIREMHDDWQNTR